ncbi:MAG: spore cortex-lytic enzyme [Clostridia bacterium]|nr:spore cortex-lytic enzyme [Clostridia bacterium]
MNKRVKITALILSAAALLITGFAVFNFNGGIVSAVAKQESVTFNAIYKQGSRGATVKTIQQKLKRWGYYTGAVDGIFGTKTKEAVKYFQRKNGLKVDGIVGSQTLKALGIYNTDSSNNSSTSSPNYSNADVTLLAHLIYGEARGESYTGQIAVGAVVMNRLKSSSFPNTISAVIYQPWAFTAVADGQINLTPNEQAYRAAREAMNGYDPTYGALYYYNPKTATSSWIFSRKTTVVIGRHVFAV